MIKRRFVMNRTSILFLLIIGLMMVTLAPTASGTENLGDISIRVDGLTCPFCAYGLEKKLKRLEGAEKIHIDIEKGIAYIQVREGKDIKEKNLKKAVEDAGFTAKEITYGIYPK